MKKRYKFKIVQGGIVVAAGSAPYFLAIREAEHYAMMYRKDGPVEVVLEPEE